MKTYELLRESGSDPFSSLKAINVEFKALAKAMDLTLVAGMGWPNINQDGGWFGGGLGARGGSNRREGPLTIPVETLHRAFLQALAKKLEGYLDEGREIKIARGADRKSHSEKAVKGQILQQLTQNIVVEEPPNTRNRGDMPCVTWFVGLAPDLANKSVFRAIGNFFGPPPEGNQFGGKHLFAAKVGTMMDLADSKKISMAYNKFYKANADYLKWNKKTNVSTRQTSTPKWRAFIRDMAIFLAKVVGETLPADFSGAHANYFTIDRKFLPDSTQRLTPKQLENLLALMWKHIK